MIDLGPSSQFRFMNIDSFGVEYRIDRAVRILYISKDPCSDGACLNTGRKKALGNSMVAPGTFISNTAA